MQRTVYAFLCSMNVCERLNRVPGIANITLSDSDEDHMLYVYVYFPHHSLSASQ
jgi:hypothetical protein